MELSTTEPKPTSSPGRIDKFPPPLMIFLRTNAAKKAEEGQNQNQVTLCSKSLGKRTLPPLKPKSLLPQKSLAWVKFSPPNNPPLTELLQSAVVGPIYSVMVSKK